MNNEYQIYNFVDIILNDIFFILKFFVTRNEDLKWAIFLLENQKE